MTVPSLRVARPTDNLPALLRFYCDDPGLRRLTSLPDGSRVVLQQAAGG